MLYLHSSNRLEILAQSLAELIRAPLFANTPSPSSGALFPSSREGKFLESEIICVPSHSLRTWLTLALAKENGIAANIAFSFPRPLIEQMLTTIASMTETAKADTAAAPLDPFAPEVCPWRIMKLLPTLFQDNPREFTALRAYLAADAAADNITAKHYELAQALSQTFNDYLIYRPWLLGGGQSVAFGQGRRQGGDTSPQLWQGLLAQAISQDAASPHLAERIIALATLLDNTTFASPSNGRQNGGDAGYGGAGAQGSATSFLEQERLKRLPRRLTLFGFAHLPPLFLFAFSQFARLSEVHIFTLNPSYDFWFDSTMIPLAPASSKSRPPLAALLWEGTKEGGEDTATVKKEEREVGQEEGSPILPFVDAGLGNRLLLLWGGLARDFWELLLEIPKHEEENFEAIERVSLLSNIQADIFENLPPRAQAQALPDEPFPSLKINSCHSERRELEALQDFLLDAFANDAELLPKDIIVMTPDIKLYAPLVGVVWGAAPAARRLPYRIVGAQEETETTRALFALFDTASGRFTANGIISLLEIPILARANGFSEGDVEIARLLLKEAGINWGWDAQQRTQYGLPAFAQGSWRSGLARLLLGYALLPAASALPAPATNVATTLGATADASAFPFPLAGIFRNIAPVAGIEGDVAFVLGLLADFGERLFALATLLTEKHPPAEWQEALSKSVRGFFGVINTTDSDDFAALFKALAKLKNDTSAAGFTEALPFSIIRKNLEAALADEEHRAFISGAITFCSLLPQRPVPFKIICLLGMGATAFPRQEMRTGFNLIANQRRRGDKTRRTEDIHLFLETLTSARDRLYLSYIGKSARDNSELPPCTPLADLQEYISANYHFAKSNGEKEDCLARIFEQHPLHGFSPRNFSASSPRSYSSANLECARALSTIPKRATSLLDVTPPRETPSLSLLNEEDTHEIKIEHLLSFFKNPARCFWENYLKAQLPRPAMELSDVESLNLTSLPRFLLGEKLLAAHLASTGKEAALPTDGSFTDFLSQLLAASRAEGLLPVGTAGDAAFGALAVTAASLAAKSGHLPVGEVLPPLEIGWESGALRITGRIVGIGKERLVRYRFAKFKARDLLGAWIEHLLLNVAAEANYPRTSLIVFTNKIISLREAPAAAQHLTDLLILYERGRARPLPFFPETSYAFFKEMMKKGENRTAAWLKARQKWQGAWGNKEQGSPAEGKDPYFRLSFGEEGPFADPPAAKPPEGSLLEEFECLALRVFEAMSAHIDEKRGKGGTQNV